MQRDTVVAYTRERGIPSFAVEKYPSHFPLSRLLSNQRVKRSPGYTKLAYAYAVADARLAGCGFWFYWRHTKVGENNASDASGRSHSPRLLVAVTVEFVFPLAPGESGARQARNRTVRNELLRYV